MASGDKRIGTQGDSMAFGTELICVGPLLLTADLVFPVYVPLGMGQVRVKKVRSVVTVALTGSTDSVTTISDGVLTIAGDAAVAVEDSCTIVHDGTDDVAEEGTIVLSIAVGSTVTAGEAVFFIELERCQ